jgi:competence protein ComEA
LKDYLAKNKQLLVLLLAIIAVVMGIIVLLRMQTISRSEEIIIDTSDTDDTKSVEEEPVDLIKVDISGEVKSPGVYEFEEGQIIEDALQKAGGLTEEADSEYVEKSINRAEKLTDQQKIYIPAKAEAINSDNNTESIGSTDISGVSGTSRKVNINSASLNELDSLPGIGPAYAQKIIDGRPYSKIEDVKSVKGIGDATFEKIKDQITI